IYLLVFVIIALVVSLSVKVTFCHSIFSYLLGASLLLGGIFLCIYGTIRLKAYVKWGEYMTENNADLSASFKKKTLILDDHPAYLFFCAEQAIQHKNFEKAIGYLEEAISYTFYPKYY